MRLESSAFGAMSFAIGIACAATGRAQAFIPHVEIATLRVTNHADRNAVRRNLLRHGGEVSACFEQQHGTSAPRGSVVLHAEVAADGSVTPVTVTRAPRSLAAVASCVQRAMQQWHLLGVAAPFVIDVAWQMAYPPVRRVPAGWGSGR